MRECVTEKERDANIKAWRQCCNNYLMKSTNGINYNIFIELNGVGETKLSFYEKKKTKMEKPSHKINISTMYTRN